MNVPVSVSPAAKDAAASGNAAQYQPPWVDLSIIGIAGGSGSGKTTFALKVIEAVNLPSVMILSMDSFYKTLTPEQQLRARQDNYDFDCPESIDFDLLLEVLKDLKQGKKVDIPTYSFAQHQRMPETVPLYSPQVLVLEGILALHDPRVADILDLKVYIEADIDICLGRRLTRDVQHRARHIDGILQQWNKFVKPNFKRYVEPQRYVSDMIVPHGNENPRAIDLVIGHIEKRLREKSEKHVLHLESLGNIEPGQVSPSEPLSPAATAEVASLTTSLQDNELYFDQLAPILIREALNKSEPLPAALQKLSGEASEPQLTPAYALAYTSSLSDSVKKWGTECATDSLVIEVNEQTKEPEVQQIKLSGGIRAHSTVVLVDKQITSANQAIMAIRVLIDHGVDEAKIVLVACVAARKELSILAGVYPKTKLVVGQILEDI